MDYLDIESARSHTGLRLVLTGGVPGPWGEAAKGVFHAKGVAYAPVLQEAGTDNEALVAWTGHRNAPQAVYEDEPARIGWAEIVFLAERLGGETPSLLPGDISQRIESFGLSNEICGEGGFGWSRRLVLFEPLLGDGGDPPPQVATLAEQYRYSAHAARAAHKRCDEILAHVAARLHAQRARGSAYLIGDSLSAVDIHWACFAAMVQPLPAEVCPMPGPVRAGYGYAGSYDPIVLEHRDFVYEKHLPLPLDF